MNWKCPTCGHCYDTDDFAFCENCFKDDPARREAAESALKYPLRSGALKHAQKYATTTPTVHKCVDCGRTMTGYVRCPECGGSLVVSPCKCGNVYGAAFCEDCQREERKRQQGAEQALIEHREQMLRKQPCKRNHYYCKTCGSCDEILYGIDDCHKCKGTKVHDTIATAIRSASGEIVEHPCNLPFSCRTVREHPHLHCLTDGCDSEIGVSDHSLKHLGGDLRTVDWKCGLHGGLLEGVLGKKKGRLGFAPGPWDDEPDHKEWRATPGIDCIVDRHADGHLNGYVSFFVGNVVNFDLIKIHYVSFFVGNVVNFDLIKIHGGITYDENCHPTTGKETPGRRWIGFDAGHFGDLTPSFVGITTTVVGVYRTFDWVVEETKRLAEQVAKQIDDRRLTREEEAQKLIDHWKKHWPEIQNFENVMRSSRGLPAERPRTMGFHYGLDGRRMYENYGEDLKVKHEATEHPGSRLGDVPESKPPRVQVFVRGDTLEDWE